MTLTRSFNSLKFFRRELPNCQVKLELLGTANFSKPSLLMTCPFADYLILKHHLPRLENILQSKMIVIQDIFSLLCVIRTVDDHLLPHEQTCDAKGTRGEWWTCCFSQQNDNKWGEEMSKREYKSQYSTEPKFSHGTRWTVRLSNDASSFQKLKLMIVRYFNWSLF